MKIITGIDSDLLDESVISLIREGVYKPTADKMASLFSVMRSEAGLWLLAIENDKPLGALIAVQTNPREYTIRNIIVDESHRRSGTGRKLIFELVGLGNNPKILAETDDDAVGFYHSVGFRVQSLGEKYPGIIRYRCVYDHSDRVEQDCMNIIENESRS